MYEKIKIQQSTLNKGEIQYKSRVEDIRILKLEIKRLRREKKILSVKVSNVDDLRFVERFCSLRFSSFFFNLDLFLS